MVSEGFILRNILSIPPGHVNLLPYMDTIFWLEWSLREKRRGENNCLQMFLFLVCISKYDFIVIQAFEECF